MALVSLAVLGYAYYLVYVFAGGTYVVNFKILLLPLFFVIGIARAIAMRRDAKQAPKKRAAQEAEWAEEQRWHAERQKAREQQAVAADPSKTPAAVSADND